MTWDEQRATTNLNQIITSLESQIDALGEQISTLQVADDATEDQIDGRI